MILTVAAVPRVVHSGSPAVHRLGFASVIVGGSFAVSPAGGGTG